MDTSLKQDPGNMDTQKSPNKFHLGCQWSWSKYQGNKHALHLKESIEDK